MDDLFNVAVPDEQLEAPAFEPMPTGAYKTSLQAGARTAEQNGWTRMHLPFSGFMPTKGDANGFAGRRLEARFPVSAPPGAGNDTAVRIGREAVIGAASALGLTEPTTVEGKEAQKLVARSYDELVGQFNAMAGTDVEVYVVAKPRQRSGQPVLKADGTAVIDNEIRNVRALRAERS